MLRIRLCISDIANRFFQIITAALFAAIVFAPRYSVAQEPDTLTVAPTKPDSLASKDILEYPIMYDATDSLSFEFDDGQKVFLFGEGIVKYGEIELKADYIEFDMARRTVFARGRRDSLGLWEGKPVFKQDGETYETDSLHFNFLSQKGVTYGVATKISEGYLHGEVMKKHDDGTIHIANGKFTTCEYEHPHYYIALTEAKAKSNDKIVSGPLYFVIADIPTPLALPFGYFPDNKMHASGILIPSYGEEKNRGFYLSGLGYYMALNDYVDVAIVGDGYSEGSWALNLTSKYKWRYHFSGGLNLTYSQNFLGEKGTDSYSKSTSYSIRWNHAQDAKARPNTSFSANVNMQSSNNQQFNSRTTEDYLSNTYNSSVSYSKRWPGRPFNFTANLNHSQNTSTKQVTFKLPTATFAVDRQMPFQLIQKMLGKTPNPNSKNPLSKLSIGYSANFENSATAPDSVIFTSQADFIKNLKHDIPISMPVKLSNPFKKLPLDLLNYTTLTFSANYYGRLYDRHLNKHYEDEFVQDGDTLRNQVVSTDEKNGLEYAHIINPNVSLSVAPKFYGFYGFRNPDKHRIKAVRHVMSPSVSLGLTPSLEEYWNDKQYYDYYISDDKEYEYYIYQNGLYPLPGTSKRSGSMSFSLGNNLEMKVKERSDTTDTFKKVMLLNSLNFSASYTLYRDSMNLSDIRMSGNTRLFKKLLNVNFGAAFDPYMADETGKAYNVYRITENYKQPLALKSANVSLSMGLNPKSFANDTKNTTQGVTPLIMNPVFGYSSLQYIDFRMPWNLSFNYSYNLSRSKYLPETKHFEFKTVQSLSFSGDLKMTDTWRFGFSSGYDFEAKKLTYTSANLYRDLHCWEMRINWIPFGPRQSYNFQINIKSATFKDLKYKKEKTHFDNLSW